MANSINRRAVLCGFGLIALNLIPGKALASGKVKILPSGKIQVLLSQNTELRMVGGVIQFQDKEGRNLALIRTSNAISGFKAINLSCTHQGVVVQMTENGWLCKDGHQAVYARDGKVISGPARIDLRSIPVKTSKSRVIVG
jgi:Rieske Fe-S protein